MAAPKRKSPWRRVTGSHGPYVQTFDGHFSKSDQAAKHQRQAANRQGWELAQGLYPAIRDALLAGVPESVLHAAVAAAISLAAEVHHGG